MCRMFGLLASRPVAARPLLRDAPRSLWTLSGEHPDGWGVAVGEPGGWTVHRDTACAQASPRFDAVVDATCARVVVAHIRKKTVGDIALANTHPFRRGALVFAHNGTVEAPAALAAGTSPARAAEIAGDTDSERLFAFVASAIDRAGDVERGVIAAVRALHAHGPMGSISFLLGAGAKYSLLGYKIKDTDVSIDVLAVEASTGLALPLGNGKLLEVGLGYDMGLNGSVKGKTSSETTSHEISEARRLNQEARLLFAVAKSSSVGFGITWFTQSISANGTDGDIDVKGYVLSGAYAVAF